MKHLLTLCAMLIALAGIAQNPSLPNAPIPIKNTGVSARFERSPRYNKWEPANHRYSSSRSNVEVFTMDYGALDEAYNDNILQGAGFFYRDDQFSFTSINTSAPIDSTEYAKWAITWYPKVIDMDNNPQWPFTEHTVSKLQMTIDTIFMTIGHTHKSNKKDTITISVWDLEAFTSVSFDTGATGTLLGRITVITDTSVLGGTGEGSSPGTYLLADHFPFVPSSPIVIPTGRRFLIQTDFKGPTQDKFYLSSSRRNDCASQCGASVPYVNGTFNSNISNFNSLFGIRYVDRSQNISGIYPSTLFFNDCNSNAAKDSVCEEKYAQDAAIYPHIKASIADFYVDATSNVSTACPGSVVTLTANGGGSSAIPYTYSWTATSGNLTSTGDQQVTLELSNQVVNDTVIITLTDNNNVSTRDTVIIKTGGVKVNITNNQPIVLACSASATITTTLSGTTLGKFYKWSTGDQGAAKSSIVVSTAQNVSLTVTNSAGCSATASAQVVYNGTNNNVSFNNPLANGIHQWAGCALLFKNTSSSIQQPWVATFDPTGFGTDILTITDGNPNIVYTYASPGVYVTKLTMDSAGCSFSKTQSVTITTKPVQSQCDNINAGTLAVSLGQNVTTCAGNTVVLNPVITNGISPYTFSWSSSGSTLTCTNCRNPLALITQNSTFTVTVTDAQQSTASATVNYFIRSGGTAMKLSFSNTPITCISSSGSSTVTVTNGVAPFSFNWGDGATTSGGSPTTHIYNYPSAFLVTVTDSFGCQASAMDTIQNNGVKAIITLNGSPRCDGDYNGSLIATGSGGTIPYTYEWYNGSTNDTITNLHSGTYWLTVTDKNGCQGISHYTLSSPGNNFYVYLNSTNSNCGNNGSITTSLYGGLAPFRYRWNTGDSTKNLSGVAGGSYNLTVTDARGCSAIGYEYVYTSCKTVVSGVAFKDVNGNCIKDGGEPALANQYIVFSNGTTYYYGYTDNLGKYTVQINETGTYTIDDYNYYASCAIITPCSGPIGITTLGDSITNYNLAYSTASGFDLQVHPGWTSANPGFPKEYWLLPFNASQGTSVGQPVTVVFNYDSNLVYQSSMGAAPVHDAANHTLTWIMTNVPTPFYDWTNRFRCFFMVPLGLSLDYKLQTSFTIYPVSGDCKPSNNTVSFSEDVKGSHDPNEKEVSPAGYMYEDDSLLTYTIHFQNNGTDSTHFIIVRDSLSSELNPATVHNIASSHPYTEFKVSEKGILEWVFNPLRLVDSLTNPEGSKGFVKFTVEKRSNRSIGTVISNRASIYFDYNEPVMTNTVNDTLAARIITGLPSLSHSEIGLNLFPNPAATKLFVAPAGFTAQYIAIYDMNGRKLSEQKFLSQLDITALSAGIYFIEARGADGMVRKKFVKE